MTDYTAIYETAESIAELLRSEMSPEPVAKKEQIGICEPQSPEDYQLTVWIYNIEEQKDSGPMTGYIPDPENPLIERFAPIRLRLQMLISAHSKAPAIQKYADEYRMIGRALQILRDNPSIPQEFLQGSLADQTEPVTIEITKLTNEELTRIWNNTQKTVRPSFGITLSQVMMKSNRTKAIGTRVASAEFVTNQRKLKGR
ncbi:MAG: DUF4255 domain-containing protein [Oscillospiraceae bacterium]